jgi:hypothetical protein
MGRRYWCGFRRRSMRKNWGGSGGSALDQELDSESELAWESDEGLGPELVEGLISELAEVLQSVGEWQ